MSSRPTTAAKRGCGRGSSSPTWDSTRWSAGRRTSTASSRRASTRCGRGAWDMHARVADMELDGVYASLCFPSFLPGFVGQRLTLWPDDADLALTAMRAYNDWHLDAWCGAEPGRFIPNQIAYLRDPDVAAEEIRRNAARGFKAVTFSEAPDKLGLPTIHSGHWDPLFAACAETGTVLCLHVGSSGTSPTTSADAPPEIPAVLFGAYGMYSAVDWLYSKVPVRFPDLRICLSEGGIGWVAGILDRLDHCYRYQLGYLPTWRDVDLTPSEVMRRNFWFCALDDDAGMMLRDRIGVDHILVESDYPHADSSWPDTQAMLTRHFATRACPTRTRAGSRGRTRRSCSATRCPPTSRGDTRAGRRAERPRAARRARVRGSRGGTTADVARVRHAFRSDRRDAAGSGLGAGRPGRVPAPRRRRRPRADARMREGRPRRRGDRRPGRRARGRAPGVPHRGSHADHRRRAAAGRRACTCASAGGPGAPGRRAVVPQLDVGHDRPPEDRHARPGPLVRLSHVRAADRVVRARRRVPEPRCPRRSASGSGPRTSRPRSSVRRASCARASRPRTCSRPSSGTASRCSPRCRPSS